MVEAAEAAVAVAAPAAEANSPCLDAEGHNKIPEAKSFGYFLCRNLELWDGLIGGA